MKKLFHKFHSQHPANGQDLFAYNMASNSMATSEHHTAHNEEKPAPFIAAAAGMDNSA